jgi:hypothetical protein
MSDDWRLEITLHGSTEADKLTEELEGSEAKRDLDTSFHDRLVVSGEEGAVFCYAGSREQAQSAEQLVRSLAAEHGWELDYELRRWHPAAEQWEDPDVPLPESDIERNAEHAELIERERQELDERGYPEFEVRVKFVSRHDAEDFADKLRGEGLPSARRWKYLVIGATDEDSAQALAERLRREAGPTATVIVEGSRTAAYNERPAGRFWFLGGLGG